MILFVFIWTPPIDLIGGLYYKSCGISTAAFILIILQKIHM